MILYEKFGFQLRLLNKDDGIDIFRLLSTVKLSRQRGIEMNSKDRRVLKKEIMFALTKPNYNPIGLFKNDKLIGISFSSVTEEEKTPWLGYFYIHKDNRKGKGSIVLINYLINHLYKGAIIQMGATDLSLYGKLVKPLPALLEFSIFNSDVGPRLKRICGED